MNGSHMIGGLIFKLLCVFIVEVSSSNYLPTGKEHFLTDAFLREVVNRMGKDLAEVAADSYLNLPDSNRISLVGERATKDIENEERLFPLDYDSLGETNINPSIRDQEYLQHSSLWGNQYMSGGAGEGKQLLKPEGTIKNNLEIKTDSNLPAYCNPPNPCPIGYTEAQGCISSSKFENTAAFSRSYQGSQDCMCDSEHMFDCPNQSDHDSNSMSDALDDISFDHFLQQNFKQQNPFLQGERLPVAAKKGNNVLF
ncbi:neuroendocrine protein 7B2 isoform X2 [Chrysoperla carnea]|uniref:neuroendocrine protein 7B2 isoform X2 n=1 Tax=Chrysoperla carnea TaxID=189513 RepID=UPI001D07C9F4|nr:neuroendocrine protein 7B2 isoform X2 [Chrysoperla carnea]